MENVKRSVFDTTLPVIIISYWDLEKVYPLIGEGLEGSVYKYNSLYALKLFDNQRAIERYSGKYHEILDKKFAKIEELSKLNHPMFCCPRGLVGADSKEKEGIYLPLIKTPLHWRYLNDFAKYNEKEETVKLLVEASDAIEWAHSKGITLGDIKPNNIMIDANNKAVFIDTDNFAYKDWGFDLFPARVEAISKRFNDSLSLRDIDIYNFTLMAFNLLNNEEGFNYGKTNEEIKEFINNLQITKEDREILNHIFSDSHNKPYPGPVLKRINPNFYQK